MSSIEIRLECLRLASGDTTLAGKFEAFILGRAEGVALPACNKSTFNEYFGLSYEQASRAAEMLVVGQGWFRSFERLSALKEIMDRHPA